jgi:hypothetical protein
MQNIESTILAQYANSPILMGLLNEYNSAVDPSPLYDDFYNEVWNVSTAGTYGLDVWGRIVGVSRIINLPSGVYLGFDEGGFLSYSGFNQDSFYSGAFGTTNYKLSNDEFRVLIMAKALANISQTNIKTYNDILLQLYPGRGNVYVIDNGHMLLLLTFLFPITKLELAILKQAKTFFNPTGVGTFVYALAGVTQGAFNSINSPSDDIFGFEESSADMSGFDSSTFWGNPSSTSLLNQIVFGFGESSPTSGGFNNSTFFTGFV